MPNNEGRAEDWGRGKQKFIKYRGKTFLKSFEFQEVRGFHLLCVTPGSGLGMEWAPGVEWTQLGDESENVNRINRRIIKNKRQNNVYEVVYVPVCACLCACVCVHAWACVEARCQCWVLSSATPYLLIVFETGFSLNWKLTDWPVSPRNLSVSPLTAPNSCSGPSACEVSGSLTEPSFVSLSLADILRHPGRAFSESQKMAPLATVQ